ncbi:Lipase 3 [Papilio machaon]|uniref:Lipase 3 n=1 Tax=Papilio machaon TaxID=76193 RepID=A0A194QS63_PAPMA|nr:Lipase 3 [Papilio machaon]
MGDFAYSLLDTIRNVGDRLSHFFQNRETVKKGITTLPRKTYFWQDATAKYTKTTKALKRTAKQAPPLSAYTTKTLHYKVRSDPMSSMDTPQLITLHGRRAESHIVLTEDGYLLTLHRIVASRSKRSPDVKNNTVLLHHGLLGSSADWVLLGAKKSLPYLLSNLGYDIWLANARGNVYSRGHVSKNINNSDFWKFSWQEMGQYDLPAIIHYIRLVKNTSDPISFVGHSMGATALLVLLSTSPIFNTFIRIGILIAPLAFMVNSKGPLRMFGPFAPRPPLLQQVMSTGEFMPSKVTPEWLSSRHCARPQVLCRNPLFYIAGDILQGPLWDENLLTRVLNHVPAGTSTYTISHYAQLTRNGKFHKFGDVITEFPLNRISLPIALISSSEDWLATLPDVKKLYFGLSNPIDHFVIRNNNFSHTEFVWGPKADIIVFRKVIDYIKNGLSLSVIKLNEV